MSRCLGLFVCGMFPGNDRNRSLFGVDVVARGINGIVLPPIVKRCGMRTTVQRIQSVESWRKL